MELEGGKAFTHPGNYSSYLKGKSERLEGQLRERGNLERWLKKEAEWAMRQPKVCSSREKC